MAVRAPDALEQPPPSSPPAFEEQDDDVALPWFKMAAAVCVLASIALVVCGDVPTLTAGVFVTLLGVLGWVTHSPRENGARLLAAAAALGAVPVLALLAMGAFNRPLWGAYHWCGFGEMRRIVGQLAFGSVFVLLTSALAATLVAQLLVRHSEQLRRMTWGLCVLGLAATVALSGWQLWRYLSGAVPRHELLGNAPVVASLPPTTSPGRSHALAEVTVVSARLQLHRICRAQECFAFVRRLSANDRSDAMPNDEAMLDDGTDMDGHMQGLRMMLPEMDRGHSRDSGHDLMTQETRRYPATLSWTLGYLRNAGALVLKAGKHIEGVYGIGTMDDAGPIQPSSLNTPLAPPVHALWAALAAFLGGLGLVWHGRHARQALALMPAAREGWCDGDGWLHFDDSPPQRVPHSIEEGPALLYSGASAMAYRGALREGIAVVEGTRALWEERLRRRLIRYQLEALAWSTILVTPLLGLALL